MSILKTGKIPLWTAFALGMALYLCSACSSRYQNDRFIFQVPAGTDLRKLRLDGEIKLWLNEGNIYFGVVQSMIMAGSSLEEIFNNHRSEMEGRMHEYLFISEARTEFRGVPAIETIYRGFNGAGYLLERELWIEKDGWVYLLECSEAINFNQEIEVPISEVCYKLAEGFQFKE